jgi:two-component sensor histidine kinase
MNIQDWFNDPLIKTWLIDGLLALIGLIALIFIFSQVRKSNRKRAALLHESIALKKEIQDLRLEFRERLISSLKNQARLIALNPVVPGNSPEDISLEGRTRTKCIDLILEDLPRDIKGTGIRMAEFLHHLADNLFQAYGKDPNNTNILIEAQAVILDVECAAHVGLMYNELIANALQYGIDPGIKQKINVILKERDNKLFISVGDNGIGMKVPYEPKFSFGLQLVNSLVHKYKGKMIINSRPGTRVEIYLSEYTKVEREVFVTPTQRLH